jgi:hypothetical protein
MEAKGSFKIVTELYTTTNAFVCTSVKVKDGRMLQENWPKTEGGEKVKDTGILPLDHLFIHFLADKNHRVRTYTRYYFKLALMAAKRSRGHFGDAERMMK